MDGMNGMDICKTLKEIDSGAHQTEILVRLIMALIALSFLCCCCCCCLCFHGGGSTIPDFDSGIILQEIQDIEHQSETYEEELRRAVQRRREQLEMIEEDNIASDVNNDIGVQSDSWEAIEQSYIEEYANEYFIINTLGPDEHIGDILCSTKDIHFNRSSEDFKYLPNVSKDSDIRSNNDEDITDKCDTSKVTIHQVDKSCDTTKSDECRSQDDCDKSNIEDYNNKCNASNGSGKVDTEDCKAKDDSGSELRAVFKDELLIISGL